MFYVAISAYLALTLWIASSMLVLARVSAWRTARKSAGADAAQIHAVEARPALESDLADAA